MSYQGYTLHGHNLFSHDVTAGINLEDPTSANTQPLPYTSIFGAQL